MSDILAPVTVTHPRGVVYVATGELYRCEAAAAAAQLRRTNPTLRICLVTDRLDGPAFWDDAIQLAAPVFGFRDKLAMRLCPYEKFLYLDTDTRVTASLDEIFTLLDRFDFAGHQLFEGHDYRLPNVPDAFPEFQGGVLAFRRSPAVEAVFQRWLDLFDRNFPRDRSAPYAASNVSDQKSLRIALYESSLSLAVLGPEFDFVPAQVNFACTPVRILHGRGDLAAFESRINARVGNRVYVPRLDAILSMDTPPRELWRTWRHTSLQLLRAAGVALTPLALRNALRRSATIRRLFLGNTQMRHTADHAKKWQEK